MRSKVLDDKCVEITIKTVQVFVNAKANFGNTLGIVESSSHLSNDRCQKLAQRAGFSETVFIDDAPTAKIRIFTPKRQIPFAGHPTVGTAWFRHQQKLAVTELQTQAGTVAAAADQAGAWVQAPSAWSTPWTLIHLPSPADVEAAPALGANRHDYAWSWIDQSAGTVRARAFTSASGPREDEATGSAAMWLANELNRTLHIYQGHGSILHVAPQKSGLVRLSGHVCRGTDLVLSC